MISFVSTRLTEMLNIIWWLKKEVNSFNWLKLYWNSYVFFDKDKMLRLFDWIRDWNEQVPGETHAVLDVLWTVPRGPLEILLKYQENQSQTERNIRFTSLRSNAIGLWSEFPSQW